jgi:hypothetical protein
VRTALLAVIVAVAACHDDAPATPPATCIAAAAALRGDNSARGLDDAIANLCREQAWPRAMRDCAAYGRDPMRCLDRLSDADRDALDDLVRHWQPPRPAFLGVEFRTSQVGTGVEVVSIVPGSPAAEVGIQVGDRIERYDGARLADGDALLRSVRDSAIGDTPTLIVRRGADELVVHPTLVEMPARTR